MIYRLFPAIAMALILTGCVHRVETRCPALTQYTPEFNTALADEPKGPFATQAIIDYVNLRDRCRAINGS